MGRVSFFFQEKCHQYWPSERSARYQYFVVDPMAEYNMPQYILREFKVTDARVSLISKSHIQADLLHVSCFVLNFENVHLILCWMEWRVKDCMTKSIYLTWFSIDRMDSPELSDSSSSLIGRSRVFPSPEMASLTSLVKSTKPRNSSAKWGQSLYTAGNLSPLKLIETICHQQGHIVDFQDFNLC